MSDPVARLRELADNQDETILSILGDEALLEDLVREVLDRITDLESTIEAAEARIKGLEDALTLIADRDNPYLCADRPKCGCPEHIAQAALKGGAQDD